MSIFFFQTLCSPFLHQPSGEYRANTQSPTQNPTQTGGWTFGHTKSREPKKQKQKFSKKDISLFDKCCASSSHSSSLLLSSDRSCKRHKTQWHQYQRTLQGHAVTPGYSHPWIHQHSRKPGLERQGKDDYTIQSGQLLTFVRPHVSMWSLWNTNTILRRENNCSQKGLMEHKLSRNVHCRSPGLQQQSKPSQENEDT